jgi:uracil DNA glycosylase
MTGKKASLTREAVLNELSELLEGCHPNCQTITERFLRDPEFQQAAELLASAIQQEYRWRRNAILAPPPSWLLPA